MNAALQRFTFELRTLECGSLLPLWAKPGVPHNPEREQAPALQRRSVRKPSVNPVYHPRRHKWSYHFRYEGSTLIGRTAIGRTTIDVLRMNHLPLVALREILMAAKLF